MKSNNIRHLSADEYADLFAEAGIFPDNGPKPGSNFRQMLRVGRKDLIDLVEGANQKKTKY